MFRMLNWRMRLSVRYMQKKDFRLFLVFYEKKADFRAFFCFLWPVFGHGRLGHPQSLEYLKLLFHQEAEVLDEFCFFALFEKENSALCEVILHHLKRKKNTILELFCTS